jgi:hypothetical protein
MKIDIKNDDELNKLLNALSQEIIRAQVYHKLFCDLVDSIVEYEHEFNQSKTFWRLSLDSLKEVRLIHLCRVFDQEPKGLNLRNLLETIKANLHFFQKENFRNRLQNNVFVDSLSKTNRVPSICQINEDIKYSHSSNPIVKKLMIWRNKIIAHRDAKVSLGKTQILKNNPLSESEIETLLDKSFNILNRYLNLYSASTWSRKAIGHNDYLSLLKFLRIGLEKYTEDITDMRTRS